MNQPSVPRLYYYSSAGKRVGPVTGQQLRALAAKGMLARRTSSGQATVNSAGSSCLGPL